MCVIKKTMLPSSWHCWTLLYTNGSYAGHLEHWTTLEWI